jgi:hypothetical protein
MVRIHRSEKRTQLAVTMHDAQDQRLLVLDAVNDDVIADRKRTVSGTGVMLPGSSDIRKRESIRTRSAMVSIQVFATSMLALSLAINNQMSPRSASARGDTR